MQTRRICVCVCVSSETKIRPSQRAVFNFVEFHNWKLTSRLLSLQRLCRHSHPTHQRSAKEIEDLHPYIIKNEQSSCLAKRHACVSSCALDARRVYWFINFFSSAPYHSSARRWKCQPQWRFTLLPTYVGGCVLQRLSITYLSKRRGPTPFQTCLWNEMHLDFGFARYRDSNVDENVQLDSPSSY